MTKLIHYHLISKIDNYHPKTKSGTKEGFYTSVILSIWKGDICIMPHPIWLARMIFCDLWFGEGVFVWWRLPTKTYTSRPRPTHSDRDLHTLTETYSPPLPPPPPHTGQRPTTHRYNTHLTEMHSCWVKICYFWELWMKYLCISARNTGIHSKYHFDN